MPSAALKSMYTSPYPSRRVFPSRTYIGQLKGASSHWVTHVSPFQEPFAWQEGYGVLSFGKRSLPQVVDYVLHQRERHRSGQLIAEMERDEGDD